VRAASGLDGRDVLRVARILDVEDLDAPQDSLIVGDCATLWQELSLRDESVLRKSSPWWMLTSFWLPGQYTWLSRVGFAGSPMS
jgi:hypothetical protein